MCSSDLVYIPGEGFSTTPNERASSSLWTVPDGIREVFVAGSGPSVGEFFGMKQKEGNWYLFGGLFDLGSPEMPGAGSGGNAWWVPDKMFGMDFSKYYDYHDKNYYGSDVRLDDMGKILGVEAKAFREGLGSNPLQWPFQALYSGATTTVGTFTALDNSLKDIVGQADFSSLNDFFGGVFGDSGLSPNDLGVDNIVAGGCTEPQVPTLPGQSAPGSGSGAPGQGAPPAKGKAGAPDGNASGAGKDGVLITTAQGNPSAAAAAIEAAFRKDNQAALNKAQAEERAKQEQAAKEKAAKEAWRGPEVRLRWRGSSRARRRECQACHRRASPSGAVVRTWLAPRLAWERQAGEQLRLAVGLRRCSRHTSLVEPQLTVEHSDHRCEFILQTRRRSTHSKFEPSILK